ncbi:MAG: lipoprotein signal peptidase [Prevotella sp.]|nr:lipoprotein signal peptidase [Prevotella sp.]
MTKKPLLTEGRIAILLIIAILVIDQAIKVAVKTNMCIGMGNHIHITDWFYIEFIENNGMAYGMTFINKLALSLFRIVAIAAMGWYVFKLLRREHRKSYVFCLSFILAGAAGNLFDSMFYGLIFSPSTPFEPAHFVPFGEGYAPFLYGKVVDMFYFPIIETTWPQWMPFVGGDEFIFFSPVFNFADACISVGVVVLLLFFRKDLESINEIFSFGKNKNDKHEEASEA